VRIGTRIQKAGKQKPAKVTLLRRLALSGTSVNRIDWLNETRLACLIEGDDAKALVADFRLLVEQPRGILPAELDRLVVGQLETAGGGIEVRKVRDAKTVLLHFNSPRVSPHLGS
jgi:hypothetical protein